jgi:hypothetical protein
MSCSPGNSRTKYKEPSSVSNTRNRKKRKEKGKTKGELGGKRKRKTRRFTSSGVKPNLPASLDSVAQMPPHKEKILIFMKRTELGLGLGELNE